MIVTINTDASLCHKSKIATYAYWIKHTDFLLRGVYKFKEYPNGSTHAEIQGVINAMSILATHAQKVKCEIKKVVINCDNMGIKQHITKGKEYKGFYSDFRQKLNGPKVDFRHVKGHSNDSDARSYVNRVLDMEARNLLRKIKNQNEQQ